jgi:hypothetical protein
MRSPDGRLFGDGYDQLAGEFPGAPPAKLRELALVRFAAEKATLAGQWEEVTRLCNVFDRRANALRAALRGPGKPGRPPNRPTTLKTGASSTQLRGRLEGRYDAKPRHTGEAREPSDGGWRRSWGS